MNVYQSMQAQWLHNRASHQSSEGCRFDKSFLYSLIKRWYESQPSVVTMASMTKVATKNCSLAINYLCSVIILLEKQVNIEPCKGL